MGVLSGLAPVFCAGNSTRQALPSIALLPDSGNHLAGLPAPEGSRLTAGSFEFAGRLCIMVIMLMISSHVQATHDPGTGNYAHADYYFQTYADAKAACLASLSGWPTATCGAGTGFAKCVGNKGDGFLNTKTGDQFLHCTAVCPAHSHGTPPSCACDAGYVFDATGTSCILEQYTISLSGLGGNVMPTKTRSAYAEVTRSNGLAKSGVNVDLFLDVVPELAGQLPVTYTGTLTPDSGFTDVDGRLSFEFKAPVAGGVHTITATCANCANSPVTGTITVPGCPIPPLTSPPFTDPVAEGFENGNRWRPDLLTPGYQTKLACVEAAIDAATGIQQSYTGSSAYRPFQYQLHLFEIVQKDKYLDTRYMAAHPECQALRNEITREMGPPPGHGLKKKQKVAIPGTSRHESRTAFDLTPHGLTKAQMQPIYTGCGVMNTYVKGEPWHVQ